jgi:hypothetical protein
MTKVFKVLAQMVGGVILVGLILLALFGVVKLIIFLFTIALFVVGFALAFVLAIGLIVFLFQTINEVFFKKDPEKKKP